MIFKCCFSNNLSI